MVIESAASSAVMWQFSTNHSTALTAPSGYIAAFFRELGRQPAKLEHVRFALSESTDQLLKKLLSLAPTGDRSTASAHESDCCYQLLRRERS
jgi:hypothetical protein